MRGKFISVEGSEGAGKTTALQFIKSYFAAAHLQAIWTREPGGTPIAEMIRQLLLQTHESEKLLPQTELLLMFAARAQHLYHSILPALSAGQWVISDRYIDASYAYQGSGRALDQQWISTLDKLIVGTHYPDLTLLLDLAPEIGFERAEKRGTDKDRIEQEKIDFFIRVREGYLQRAIQDPSRIKIIDASLPLVQVEQQIQTILNEFMA